MKLIEFDTEYLNKKLPKSQIEPFHNDEEVETKFEEPEYDYFDYSNYDNLEGLLKRNNFKCIGSGSYSAAWSRPDLPYVIKIPFDSDEQWYKFAELSIEHKNNKHFPKIIFLEKFVNNKLFLTAIEKLKPFPGEEGNFVANVIRSFMNNVGRNKTVNQQGLEKTAIEFMGVNNYNKLNKTNKKYFNKYKNQFLSLNKSCVIIATTPKTGYLDIHEGNVMDRNGTIVIIDPWC